MRNMSRWFDFLFLFTIIALLSACGGGGGGSESSAPAPSASVAPQETSPSESGYRVTLIGDPARDSFAVALNASGEVAGNYRMPDGAQGVFLFSGGRTIPLAEGATAREINDNGAVVGWLERGGATQAFVYTDWLEVFDFPEGPSRAYGIDNAGRVAGRFSAGIEQAFLDGAGETSIPLPDLDGYATGLNDTGQVLIKALRPEGFGSLLLETDGSLVDLGSLGGSNTQALDLNESGQVVGWSQDASGRFRAFLWENGTMHDLSRQEWTHGSALAISEDGDILITGSTATESGIFLWSGGEWTDLENLGMEYVEVSDMNDAGQIAGWTVSRDGTFRAFLATPVSPSDNPPSTDER